MADINELLEQVRVKREIEQRGLSAEIKPIMIKYRQLMKYIETRESEYPLKWLTRLQNRFVNLKLEGLTFEKIDNDTLYYEMLKFTNLGYGYGWVTKFAKERFPENQYSLCYEDANHNDIRLATILYPVPLVEVGTIKDEEERYTEGRLNLGVKDIILKDFLTPELFLYKERVFIGMTLNPSGVYTKHCYDDYSLSISINLTEDLGISEVKKDKLESLTKKQRKKLSEDIDEANSSLRRLLDEWNKLVGGAIVDYTGRMEYLNLTELRENGEQRFMETIQLGLEHLIKS